MSQPEPEATTTAELPTAVMLQAIRDGGFLVDVGDAIRDLARAVTATGKKGDVVVRLSLEPNGEHGVIIVDDVTVKLPRRARPSTHQYVDDVGNLTDTHPDHLPLGPVREVPPAEPKEVRKV